MAFFRFYVIGNFRKLRIFNPSKYETIRKIRIIPDNDAPGLDFARNVCRAIFQANMFYDPAKEGPPMEPDVKLLTLPGVPEKGDVSDWIEALESAGKSPAEIAEDLTVLCKETPPITEKIIHGWELDRDKSTKSESAASQPKEAASAPARSLQIESDADYFPQFVADVSNPPPLIPTGFIQLDQFLKGGLRPGLYTFGAVPSLGKTTFVIQIADFVAASGRDVLFFTLEMSRNELLAKSISRFTAQLHDNDDFDFAKTSTDILDDRRCYTESRELQDQEMEVFRKAMEVFQESVAPRRFVVEPEGRCDFPTIESSIGGFLQKRQPQTGQEGKTLLPPIILVDYLQIIAPTEGKDLRLHMDDTVFSLKSLSKKLRTPVFIISSFNRSGYGRPISYESFKESGGIEYNADFLSGLNPICVNENKIVRPGKAGYDPNIAKSLNPRIVELVILKNRHGETSGETGIFYEYFPAYNLFRELDADRFEVETEEAEPRRFGRKKSAVANEFDSERNDGQAAASGEKDDREF